MSLNRIPSRVKRIGQLIDLLGCVDDDTYYDLIDVYEKMARNSVTDINRKLYQENCQLRKRVSELFSIRFPETDDTEDTRMYDNAKVKPVVRCIKESDDQKHQRTFKEMAYGIVVFEGLEKSTSEYIRQHIEENPSNWYVTIYDALNKKLSMGQQQLVKAFLM